MRIVLLIFVLYSSSHGQTVTISGFVKEAATQEALPFTNIVAGFQEGTSSNNYGYYSLAVPAQSKVTLLVSRVGYETLTKIFFLYKDTVVNLSLSPLTKQLGEVTIASDPSDSNLYFNEISTVSIEKLPGLLGEKDPLKAIQLLPGVQRGIEGTTAIYTRGGDPGQNLIVMDDATIYNANHMFGFFSIFNGDAVKQINYWKGGFPARYGGRISSVIDIKLKDGDRERMNGEITVGLLSSKLKIEGPLDNNSSFLLSARRTYFDILLTPFMSSDSKFKYRFYDMNLKYNRQLGLKDKVFLSLYSGDDKFGTEEINSGTLTSNHLRSSLAWGNASGSFRWNHIISNRLFANSTFAFTNYQFKLQDSFLRTGTDPLNEFSSYSSGIRDFSAKTDFDYFHSNDHNITAGFDITFHRYLPSIVFYENPMTSQAGFESVEEHATESAIYIQDDFTLSTKSTLDAGVRLGIWHNGSSNFFVAEPRVSWSFQISDRTKFLASYARANQFVHLLTNTGPGLPTDLWVPANTEVRPQRADIGSVAILKKVSRNVALSLEGYAKSMHNIISYAENSVFQQFGEGARFIKWQENVTSGKGEAYGIESLVKKDGDRFFGSLAYTLSAVIYQFPAINGGRKFYPQHDSRHNVNLFSGIKFSDKVSLTFNWQFNSGTPFNVAQQYYFANFATGTNTREIFDGEKYIREPITRRIQRAPYFGSRNSYRGDAYHRLDISIQFHKSKHGRKRYWEFGLFNAYNRRNPFYYYLEARNDPSGSGQIVDLKKKSFLPVLPSVSYNLKFR